MKKDNCEGAAESERYYPERTAPRTSSYMKGKGSAIIMAVALLTAALAVPMFFSSADTDDTIIGANDIWDGSLDSDFGLENGTGDSIGDPIMISTPGQLALLAYLVNTTSTNALWSVKYYTLANDIYLNDTSSFNTWDSVAPDNTWTPIGTSTNTFKGSFDGNGSAVYGIYVPSGNYKGLFGYAAGSIISDIGIEQSYINGTSWVGGVVGYARNSVIDHCYNAGTINGNARVGGIAGQAYDNTTITLCYNTGAINGTGTGSNSIGGIAGLVNVSSIVVNCFNTGTVTGGRIGGVLGQLNNTSVLVNSYNSGDVIGENAGGLIGNSISSHMYNCYNIGIVDSLTGGTMVGTITGGGNIGYYLDGPMPAKGSGTGTVTATAFDTDGIIISGTGTLLDSLNAWVDSPVPNTLAVTYSQWVVDVYPMLTDMCVDVTVTVNGSGDASLYPDSPLSRGTEVTVIITGVINSITDNGIEVDASDITDNGDGTFSYTFIAHKDHAIVVSLNEKTCSIDLWLLLLAAVTLFTLIAIGLYRKRDEEER